MGRGKRFAFAATVVAMCWVASSCSYARDESAFDVTDVGATVNGQVLNTVVGPTVYWFDYGLTSSYGSHTDHQTVTIDRTDLGPRVPTRLTGLTEGTIYHYRLCTRGQDGVGICGGDATFTTTAGHDSVLGDGAFTNRPPGYDFGARVNITSDPGWASGATGFGTISPGWGGAPGDIGVPTCLEVVGNRATIGLSADDSIFGGPVINRLVHIEDNGPSGDRLSTTLVDSPPTICPAPTNADFPSTVVDGQAYSAVVTSGDYEVHDH